MERQRRRKEELMRLQRLMEAGDWTPPWKIYSEEEDWEQETETVEGEPQPMEGLEEQGSSQPPPVPAAPCGNNTDPEAPQYLDDMAEHYLEAARRLPIAQMPRLAGVLSSSALLIGFNDPVTNVIVNAVYMMEKSYSGTAVVPRGADAVRHAADRASYVDIARRSRAALLEFMTFYFRHLTRDQAKRYLRAARHDLTVAIALVNYHRDGSFGPPVSPGCGRTKTALRYAAEAAQLRCEQDYLGPILAARYPCHLLDPVLDDLRRGEKLSMDSVNGIVNLIKQPWTPQPPPPFPTPGTFRDANGNFTIISIIGQDLFSTTTITKDRAAAFKNNRNEDIVTTTTISWHHQSRPSDIQDTVAAYLSTGSDRASWLLESSMRQTTALQLQPDTKSLKMCLLDTMHGLYIQALAMLPSDQQPRLLPAVLAGGHCYGGMEDPVSNIVVNSIWYNARFPHPEADHADDHAVAMKAIRSMTRAESSSLHGLIAIVRADRGGVTEQEAVACLLNNRGNLAQLMMTMASSLAAAAAEAAKHPQPAALAAFVASLTGEKRDRLRSLLVAKRVLSDADFTELNMLIVGNDDIAAAPMMQRITTPEPDPSPFQFKHDWSPSSSLGFLNLVPPDPEVRSVAFGSRVKTKCYIRTKVEELLLDYGRDNPLGPQYKLGVICGVASTKLSPHHCTQCYHVNFLASAPADDVPDDATTSPSSDCSRLFFAQFWIKAVDYFQDSKKPPVCCPIQDFNAFPGRCFICEDGAGDSIRIVHPPCGDYFMSYYVPTDRLCALAERHADLDHH